MIEIDSDISQLAIANGSMESLELFNFRNYWKYMLSKNYVFKDTTDLWNGKNLYGKVNHKGEVVYLSETNLKEYPSEGSDIVLGIDFVVDAFKDLQSHMKKAAIGQLLNLKGELEIRTPRAKKGWISEKQLYNKYIETLYDGIVGTWFKNNLRETDIKGLSSFNKSMMEMMTINNGQAILSKSAFIVSKLTPARICGLIVEISMKDHDDDKEKFTWIKDTNYEFFKASAQNHGFMIDANAPWRLIADINNPVMMKHMDKYGVTPQNLFKKYYYRSYKYDIENLKDILVGFYNTYSHSYPTIIETTTCDGVVGGKTKTTMVDRYPVDLEDVPYTHPDEYWIEMYYYIRLRELGASLDPEHFNRETKKVIQVYKHFGLDKSKDYVNMLISNTRTDII